MFDDSAKDFDWAALVARNLSPIQVAIIEALRRIDRPLSILDLVHVFEGHVPASRVSHHARRLLELGAVVVGESERVRGAPLTLLEMVAGPGEKWAA